MLNEVIKFIISNHTQYYKAVSIHIIISITAVLISIIIAIPTGILCSKSAKVLYPVLNFFNFLRITPSLAILVLVLPVLGTGFIPALVALIILGIPPMLTNTYLGFKNIDKAIIESALGMGMSSKELFFKIQIPLALPLIITGIRISSVEVIASATLASYIGAGGLGDFIFTGLSMNDYVMLFVGGASVALLSVISEMILLLFQQSITKYQRD
ncbi:osmoprotectant transport system permease protein [Clostridium acidisoli DSM 12555]|uniref:Osmoprotectant transport system permease protein n=1 Tax=Clostridium acidisoli DSM 12555 TaxID=1121291 RepID=A0A1W1XSE7_9CLOT|nr:ABC transporter permease [Clostridium acidisoli]SMC26775.1 osmoprotectant transport system permease protein [Clostridium acidisoli DSM 12555]